MSKLIKLYEISNPDLTPFMVTELWVNKDILRWAHPTSNKNKTLTYTKLTLIADDKALNILETPEEINNLCTFVQEVKVLGIDLDTVEGLPQ